MRRLLIAAVATVAMSSAAFNAFAGYASITVFGDSLSDGGNDYLYTGGLFPPSPYAQRFSNGPTAVEVLAANLGLSLTPSLSSGSNYAYGGATTGTSNYLGVAPQYPALNTLFSGNDTGTLAQVQSFTGTFGAQDLVVLWSGANDLFSGLANPAPFDPAAIISQAMGNIATSVSWLYAHGARSLLMPNLPDIGAIPFGRALGSDGALALTEFSLAFNFYLDLTIGQLMSGFAGLDILEFDTFGALNAILAAPGAFGFTNVTDRCIDSLSCITDPTGYLFWDEVHPTAATHALLGAQLYAAVPEPATLALICLGMAGLAISRRRKY